MSLTKAYVREVFSLLEQGKLDTFLEQHVDEKVLIFPHKNGH